MKEAWTLEVILAINLKLSKSTFIDALLKTKNILTIEQKAIVLYFVKQKFYCLTHPVHS